MSVSNCSTYPVCRRRNFTDGAFPPKSTSPVVSPTVFRPARTSRNVVFPLPDGPNNAVISPGLNKPLTSDRSLALTPLSLNDATS
eukprot:31450-Pelagococcus_subviridis.AAC.18